MVRTTRSSLADDPDGAVAGGPPAATIPSDDSLSSFTFIRVCGSPIPLDHERSSQVARKGARKGVYLSKARLSYGAALVALSIVVAFFGVAVIRTVMSHPTHNAVPTAVIPTSLPERRPAGAAVPRRPASVHSPAHATPRPAVAPTTVATVPQVVAPPVVHAQSRTPRTSPVTVSGQVRVPETTPPASQPTGIQVPFTTPTTPAVKPIVVPVP